MDAALEAWKARRAKVVGFSMTRHRMVKPTPPAAPVALASKFGDLYARTLSRHLMVYALECAKAAGIREDAGDKTIAGLTFHFSEVIQAALAPAAGSLVAEVSDFNRGQVGKVFEDIVGVPFTDTPRLETLLDGHLTDNVNLIKTMTGEAMGRVRAIVDANQGSNVKDLTRQLQSAVSISASHARLIARDQTLKLNGNLTKERHAEAGIESYEWDTSGDERVRPFHKEHHGKPFRWDEPPIIDKKGRREHPGGDYQCRCVAVPIIDLDAIAAKHGAPEIPPTWIDKTRPEFTPDEHKDFERAPVGFLSRWQLGYSAKGVNPHTGPTWFGKVRAEMTTVERASHAQAGESLKGAHQAAVEARRQAKAAEGREVASRGREVAASTTGAAYYVESGTVSAQGVKTVTRRQQLWVKSQDGALAAFPKRLERGVDVSPGWFTRLVAEYPNGRRETLRDVSRLPV